MHQEQCIYDGQDDILAHNLEMNLKIPFFIAYIDGV
jgi:hypothetical protein